MAYRRSRGKAGKIQPAVQTMTFTVSVPAGSTVNSVIDISQCASLVNRRFYRQGVQWAVNNLKFLSSAGVGQLDGTITCRKLPETWIMSNAWEKGFRVWQKMNNEALAETPSVKPKFLDFKIYMDEDHHDAGFGANLLPVNISGTITAGEWQPSKFVVPKTDGTDGTSNREIIATGANYPGPSTATGLNAVSLIEGYAASRGLPDVLDPNAPADASSVDVVAAENWMAALFNEGTDQDHEVLEDMITENNIAPYPFENDGVNVDTMYPGGANQLAGLQIHDLEYVTGTTIGGTTMIKGGLFPCGLIALRFVNNGDTTLNHTFTLDLVPGQHRGYMCSPMTDM